MKELNPLTKEEIFIHIAKLIKDKMYEEYFHNIIIPIF